MDIYEYFNSKTIEQYWRDKHIEPTTWDMLRIVHDSSKLKTWAEERAALLEIIEERGNEPFPDELKEWFEDEIEKYNDSATGQKELDFFNTRDTSSISAYVRQYIERRDEIGSMIEKDGGQLSVESLQALHDKYSVKGLLYFLPVTENMKKHPFEKGDILFDNCFAANDYSGFFVVGDNGDVYNLSIFIVNLISDWSPWDCELVKTTSWNDEYGGYFDDTTDDFERCPHMLRFISEYLTDMSDFDLADLLNNWYYWALEQDSSQKKNEAPMGE